MGYYGVQLKSGSDIKHWKYIKKEKRPDGTFRYYYDSSDADNNKNITYKQRYTTDSDGNTVIARKVTHISDTDKMLSNKHFWFTTGESLGVKHLSGDGEVKLVEDHYSKDRGKIERALNKAYEKTERVAYNTIYDEDSPVSKLKKKR